MSEPAQPLSRRERRAMEEAARAAEGEMTQALPVAPETESTISRRERRRLERLANPPETWTEEEELIATGQMPAMTNEVLAEQDRLAAERAAQAAAAQQAYAETAAESEPVEAPDAGVEFVPQEAEAVAQASDAGAEFVPQEPEQPVAEESVTEAAAEVPAANDGIPEGLRHLFPPGSLQARAFEAQAAAAAAAAPAPTPINNDAVDEIRRLTQEAMAGISKATTGSVPEAPASMTEPVATEPTAQQPASEAPALPESAQVFDPAPPTQPEPVAVPAAAVNVPELPEGVDVEALWNAPTVDEPVREPSPLTPAFPDVDPEPVSLDEVPFVTEVPVPAQPTAGETPGITPVWSALVPAQPAPAPQRSFEPVSLATQPTQPAQQPTMWDTHPLTHPGATPVRELPAEPVQRELPRPDLSALTQPVPSVGQPQPAAYVSTEPSTSTTSVPLRPAAEPHPGGGARHFRWAHLAVIGAIAFVLGVLAWNIARSGS